MDTVLVNTPCGPVRGLKKEGYSLFLGIPYAVTERFRMPVLIGHFDGEYDATKGVRDCYQFDTFRTSDSFYAKEFGKVDDIIYTESPMTLNIVAPEGGEKLPVLVFIHGGGFETGVISDLPYGDSSEYVKHGIVYVSIGYRLNVFGFYDGINYGHADQVAAIEWVRANISAFGGDPGRITLMGQSAGAMSMINLLCSEPLRDKICGAILMSGAGVIPGFAAPYTTEQYRPFWQKVREKAGVKTDEEFRKLSPDVMWNAWYEVSRSKDSNFHTIQPAMDGMIPPEPQKARVKSGKILDIPMMFGVTSQDMMPYIIYDLALGLAKKIAGLGHAPVYGYFFDRTPPGNSFRAFHAADLWYMFGNMDRSWRPFTETDFRLRDEMVAAAAHFVKEGNPGDPEWKPISRKNHGFRLYDGVSKGMIYPMACRKKMFHTVFKENGPL